MKTNKPLRLIRLDIRSIKKVRAVSIQPSGALTQIKGRNAQGKSTILDSVQMALAGARSIPKDPVRHGDASGEIVADFGEFKARRTIDEDGRSVLVVTNADGNPIRSPQTFLDGLVGQGLAFDPCAFSRMDPKVQAETLRRLSGLDLGAIDAERERVYAQRTALNRDHEAARARLSRLPAPAAGLPEKEITLDDVARKLSDAVNQKAENDRKRRTLADWKAELAGMDAAIGELAERIDALQKQLAGRKADRGALAADIAENDPLVAALVDPDAADARAQASKITETNQLIRARDAYQACAAEAAAVAKKCAEATERIKQLDDERAEKIRGAAMPVPGLGFNEDGVTYNGVPFAQASSAEQLRVSMAIALRMNDGLRLCLIRNGNDLDSDGLRIIEEMAEQADAQVLIERVSDGDAEDGAIVIEDGMVKANQEAATV